MRKIFLCDVETTGVDPMKNGIHELSGQIIVDREVVDVFKFDVRPFAGDEILEKAVAVSGKSVADLGGENHLEPLVVHQELMKIMAKTVNKYKREDKFFFAGFNANFDFSFVHRFFAKCGDTYCGSWFFWPPIDVAVLALIMLAEKRPQMPNFKLATVAKELGVVVEEERLHEAAYDVDLTTQILWKVLDGKSSS